MKRLVLITAAVISVVIGSRWWKQRSTDKASWATASDPLD
jgi:hypothetical protein